MKSIRSIFGRDKKLSDIVVVSGLPRSGTSMMMKMLEAGGLASLTDNLRTADTDNPKGYYEFEGVKKLPEGDIHWLPEARGKAVKVIAALVPYLPSDYRYRVLFMIREMAEVIASQQKMLINRGEDPNKVQKEELERLFQKHLKSVSTWMANQPNIKRLDINYNQLIKGDSLILKQINEFLDNQLDVDKMAAVIDPALYRQRG